MKSLVSYSLQIRMVYSFILVALVSILLVGALILGISIRIFNNREEEHLNSIALETSYELKNFFEDGGQMRDLNYSLSRYGLRNNVALQVTGPDGGVIGESYALTDNPEISLSSSTALPLLPVARIPLDFPPLENHSLSVLRFDEYFFHPVSLLLEGFLFAALVAVIAAVMLGRFFGRRIARPIIRLSEFASALSRENWDEPLPDSNSTEMTTLSESLDSMRRQLAVSFHDLESERDVMKRFLQDASHQLRTPVTALNTFLELLGSDLPAMVERRDELLEDSRQQVEKLSRIIGDLVELTRIESGDRGDLRRSCSLKELCRRAWKGLGLEPEEKGLFLDLSGPSGEVVADEHRLEMALSNILDNAVKWSPPGGRISVRITEHPGGPVVRISDQGPGIPPEDRERVFERFYQTRHSRGGSGLGLAVVKRIAEDEGGTVRAGNNGDRGAWFTISLPAVTGKGTLDDI
ncbi:MAG: HAMP domain-containing sensor histidine kinase [Spirochaetales bacterium]|nr:HAMP domain-containing sensor histidine kinase [Spirochaetales bacterium]